MDRVLIIHISDDGKIVHDAQCQEIYGKLLGHKGSREFIINMVKGAPPDMEFTLIENEERRE